MLHFTFQNMRAFYGPWLRGLGLRSLSLKGHSGKGLQEVQELQGDNFRG